MPRQPYLPGFSKKNYSIGALILKERPDLSALIGNCIAVWTYAENEIGNTFGIVLGSDTPAALDVFLTLRRYSNQREAIETAARHSLSPDDLLLLQAMMSVYQSLEAQRNDLAHGCFGICPDDPEILFCIPISKHVYFQVEVHSIIKNNSLNQDMHKTLKENLFVYRISDLKQLYDEMETFWWNAFYFNGYLRDIENERRRDELDRVRADKRIADALRSLRRTA